jgi:hypothetical protein
MAGGGRVLEGSQASPVRPSDKGSVKVKTLEWFWFSGLMSNYIIWKNNCGGFDSRGAFNFG